VVFCFDGDAAGRRAAWRALENTLPALADGKDVRFLFLPEGEDPDDFIRRRGKAAFDELVGRAVPLSEFLLSELAARHPPRSAEGRAALVNAAKPLLAQLAAPILGTLLRRRLSELTGLSDQELSGLLPGQPPSGTARGRPIPPRIAPSLVRGLLQCLLLEPELSRKVIIPKPKESDADGAALAALADFCEQSDGPLTTAGAMQHFAGTPHEPTLLAVLTAGTGEALAGESLEIQLVEGIKRYWLQAGKRGEAPAPEGAPVDLSPEELERSRQRDLARLRLGPGA